MKSTTSQSRLVMGLSYSLNVWVTRQPAVCQIKPHELNHVDLIVFSPPDPNQSHMRFSQSSISLVKSDGRNLIAYSVNKKLTRSYSMILL